MKEIVIRIEEGTQALFEPMFVQELVRCKECVHAVKLRNHKLICFCMDTSEVVDVYEDDFCNHGKKGKGGE